MSYLINDCNGYCYAEYTLEKGNQKQNLPLHCTRTWHAPCYLVITSPLLYSSGASAEVGLGQVCGGESVCGAISGMSESQQRFSWLEYGVLVTTSL